MGGKKNFINSYYQFVTKGWRAKKGLAGDPVRKGKLRRNLKFPEGLGKGNL